MEKSLEQLQEEFRESCTVFNYAQTPMKRAVSLLTNGLIRPENLQALQQQAESFTQDEKEAKNLLVITLACAYEFAVKEQKNFSDAMFNPNTQLQTLAGCMEHVVTLQTVKHAMKSHELMALATQPDPATTHASKAKRPDSGDDITSFSM